MRAEYLLNNSLMYQRNQMFVRFTYNVKSLFRVRLTLIKQFNDFIQMTTFIYLDENNRSYQNGSFHAIVGFSLTESAFLLMYIAQNCRKLRGSIFILLSNFFK